MLTIQAILHVHEENLDEETLRSQHPPGLHVKLAVVDKLADHPVWSVLWSPAHPIFSWAFLYQTLPSLLNPQRLPFFESSVTFKHSQVS